MRSQDLERLTSKHRECLIATYADISSDITLISGQQKPVGQEALDTICKEAALHLGTAEKPPLGLMACPMAMKLGNGETAVYIRDPEDDSYALSLICSSTGGLSALLNEALQLLSSDDAGSSA